ncbi:hypothetical protein CHRYSEOSP005_11680 [Chryseobacterium sp. Alg-005]|uniref:S24 family peptidase n=1 Tax=Chryseobacterium sp. Alg-005 TaxID=3159516 RepID=UPI003555AAF8
MELKERIKKVVKHLIGKGVAPTQKDLGYLMGYKTESGFSQVINQKVAMPEDFIDRLCSFDERLNKDWIINNKDSMLFNKDTLYKERVDTVTPVPFENYMMVEYVDLSVAAGELGGNNVDELPESKKRLVPKEFDNGEYLVTRVDGDSMDDGSKYSIPDGTEILIKKYYLHNGDKLPIRNNLFVINAKDGKALKQIIEHNTDEGFIVCHSYNPDFKDYKVYMEDIIEIFLYRKIVSLRPPIPDIKN